MFLALMDKNVTTQLGIGDPETRIRLIAQGRNLWKVRMLFPVHRAQEIPEQLRQIKVELAHSFGVAEHRLEYLKLLSKRRMKHGILVEMHIHRQDVPAGAARVRFLPRQAPDGTSFSDMLVTLDLFPLDDYERPLTLAAVEARLKAEGVDRSLIQWALVRDLVEECLDKQAPIFDQVIAEGELPDVGSPSLLTYPWFPRSDPAAVSAWLGLRQVEQGELLLDHQPAASGLRPGKNVFGRELSPRKGAMTRLAAGPGVSVGKAALGISATEVGLLRFRRTYADRRCKDSPSQTPAVIEAEVIRFRAIPADQASRQRWDEPLLIRGTPAPGSIVQVTNDCVVEGDVGAGCAVQVSGDLRVLGDVRDATLSVGGHLCISGLLNSSVCEVGLTAQIVGNVEDSSVYAREILADHIVGGVAEAYHYSSNQSQAVAFNRDKFLAENRRAGESAISTLRRQMTRLYEIFGPEIVQQITPDSVQMSLLRWLKKQKAAGVGNYTHSQVKELRTLLEALPAIRNELAEIAAQLRSSEQES